jgi:hypothetical protein
MADVINTAQALLERNRFDYDLMDSDSEESSDENSKSDLEDNSSENSDSESESEVDHHTRRRATRRRPSLTRLNPAKKITPRNRLARTLVIHSIRILRRK